MPRYTPRVSRPTGRPVNPDRSKPIPQDRGNGIFYRDNWLDWENTSQPGNAAVNLFIYDKEVPDTQRPGETCPSGMQVVLPEKSAPTVSVIFELDDETPLEDVMQFWLEDSFAGLADQTGRTTFASQGLRGGNRGGLWIPNHPVTPRKAVKHARYTEVFAHEGEVPPKFLTGWRQQLEEDMDLKVRRSDSNE